MGDDWQQWLLTQLPPPTTWLTFGRFHNTSRISGEAKTNRGEGGGGGGGGSGGCKEMVAREEGIWSHQGGSQCAQSVGV